MKLSEIKQVIEDAAPFLHLDEDWQKRAEAALQALEDMTVRIEIEVSGGVASLNTRATSDFNIMVDAVDHDNHHAQNWINYRESDFLSIDAIVEEREAWLDEHLTNGYSNE